MRLAPEGGKKFSMNELLVSDTEEKSISMRVVFGRR